MTEFGFMRWVSKRDEEDDETYRTADFSHRVKGGMLLADTDRGVWALWEYDYPDPAWTPDAPVSDELQNLVWSAKRYTPALALARDDMSRLFRKRGPDREATLESFAVAYEKALARHLTRQKEVPFMLAKALREEPGYLRLGQWYWVLAAKSEPAYVQWVSDDYFVYANSASDFALTREELAKLSTTPAGDRGLTIHFESQ